MNMKWIAIFVGFFGVGVAIHVVQSHHEKPAGTWIEVSEHRRVSKNITITIQLAGAVPNPGVYEVSPNKRIVDILTETGGVLRTANLERINIAEYPKEGQRIVIPSKKLTKTTTKKININTAKHSDWEQIPGIGPKTAERIITYRSENGYFKSISELEKVKGIGKKTRQKIQSYLTL